MSKKITKEKRAALQSVRAKANKALAVDVELPKAIRAHLTSVITYVNSAIAAKGKTSKSDVVADVPAEAVAA